MNTVYVIVPINWAYDDERYNNEGFGEPFSIGFETREEAENKITELSRKQLRSDCTKDHHGFRDIFSYGWELGEDIEWDNDKNAYVIKNAKLLALLEAVEATPENKLKDSEEVQILFDHLKSEYGISYYTIAEIKV